MQIFRSNYETSKMSTKNISKVLFKGDPLKNVQISPCPVQRRMFRPTKCWFPLQQWSRLIEACLRAKCMVYMDISVKFPDGWPWVSSTFLDSEEFSSAYVSRPETSFGTVLKNRFLRHVPSLRSHPPDGADMLFLPMFKSPGESMLVIGEGDAFGAASTLATAELKGYPGGADFWVPNKKYRSSTSIHQFLWCLWSEKQNHPLEMVDSWVSPMISWRCWKMVRFGGDQQGYCREETQNRGLRHGSQRRSARLSVFLLEMIEGEKKVRIFHDFPWFSTRYGFHHIFILSTDQRWRKSYSIFMTQWPSVGRCMKTYENQGSKA